MRPGQSSPALTRDRGRRVADDDVAGGDGLEGGDEVPGREGLGEVAGGAGGEGAVDEGGVEVPGVDDDVAGARVADEDADVVVVGFGLGEGVVQGDVDGVGEGLVGVELGDDDAVGVLVEEVGEPDHDDVVVVDQGDTERCRRRAHRRTVIIRRGVLNRPDRWFSEGCGAAGQLGGSVVTLLWVLAVILVIAGIVTAFRGQVLLGIVLVIVGLLVGPGGVSVFT